MTSVHLEEIPCHEKKKKRIVDQPPSKNYVYGFLTRSYLMFLRPIEENDLTRGLLS